jgi:hypothetical protein
MYLSSRGKLGCLLLFSVIVCFVGHAASGDEHWNDRFGWPGVSNAVFGLGFHNGSVYAGGLALTGGVTTNQIDAWNGSSWSALSGLRGGALAVYDIAFIGNEMYVAGIFSGVGPVATGGLARWNGTSWSDVGGFRGAVFGMAVNGSLLYVAGSFTNAGGVIATNVAVWNGSSWSALGHGLGRYDSFGQVSAKTVVVHEGAPYVGGTFTNSGPTAVSGLARWNGANWSAVGGSVTGAVWSLASSGGSLYAGGPFTGVGGTPANNIARWNGTTWSTLGSGMDGTVAAVAVFNDEVYAGGTFATAGGVPAARIARWNGAAWLPLGAGMNDAVQVLKVGGTNLYAGGFFTAADGVVVNHISCWNGTTWKQLGPQGKLDGVSFPIRSVAASSSGVYVGGTFTGAGASGAKRIARWDGTKWWALGSGITGTNEGSGTTVDAIAVSGSNVYVGGLFTNAGGIAVNNIAKWNGASWSALGSGVPGRVSAIAVRGNDVFAGGDFAMGAIGALNIAKWNGSSWSALPHTVWLGTIGNFFVSAIAISGQDVYVGGSFIGAGPGNSRNIARHDGTDFQPLGTGVNSNVTAIALMGTNVYACGRFTNASGVAVNRIARWDGNTWSALGTGIGGTGIGSALAVIGSNLYVGGNLTTVGDVAANRIARWDGTSWSALGSGISRSSGTPSVSSLAGWGNDLYVGGTFDGAGGKTSYYFAHWNDQIDFGAVTIQLRDPYRLPDGRFGFRLTASGPGTYVIDRSSDLQTWLPIATNSTPSLDYIDTTTQGSARRFYRAHAP